MNFNEALKGYGINFKRNFNTSVISKIKSGGYADYIIFPSSEIELILSIEICKRHMLKFKIIGACSNTFFDDYNGAIISTRYLCNFKNTDNKFEIYSECGVSLPRLIYKNSENSYEIFSSLFGIPASVGGAIVNNAGAFGTQIEDSFIKCRVYDTDSKKCFLLNKYDMEFAYRKSILQKSNFVVLGAFLKFQDSSKEKIRGKISETIGIRKAIHPKEPSLGSFFKRSEGVIPAMLIDRLGLKGFKIGDAMVSEKHSGFIINKGLATPSDINELANYIENTVYSKTKIRLIREAEYVT